jgi:hypothetical protein
MLMRDLLLFLERGLLLIWWTLLEALVRVFCSPVVDPLLFLKKAFAEKRSAHKRM